MRFLCGVTATLLVLAGVAPVATAAKPVGPPAGVQAHALEPTAVEVAWAPVAGADGYRLARSTTSGGPYLTVASVDAARTTYTDSGLTPATTYYYVVETRSGWSKYSRPSAEAVASTPEAIDAPTGLAATSTGTTMELTWTPGAGAEHYEVLRAAGAEEKVSLGTTTASSFRDADIVPGHWYTYTVRSVRGIAVADSAELYVAAGTPTTTELTVSPAVTEEGQRVVLSAHVSLPGQDDVLFEGAVEFTLDGAYVGRVDIDYRDHDAMFQLTDLTAGPHVFRAQYRGGTWESTGASASAPVDHDVVSAWGDVDFGSPQVHAFGTGSDPTSVAVADVTGDGLDDVLLTTRGYASEEDDARFKLAIFAQQPDGTLAVPTVLPSHGGTFAATMRTAAGDFDADGDVDVAVAGNLGVDIYLQDGGALGAPTLLATPEATNDIVATDLDGDGRSDLVVTDATPRTVAYLDVASGATDPVVVSPTVGGLVDTGDVNGDGRTDVVGNTTHDVLVYAQDADGGFSEETRIADVPDLSSIAVGDVTGDGRADIAATRATNSPYAGASVYPQTGASTIGAPVLHGLVDMPEPLTLVDVDGDGRRDLVTVHGGWNTASVLLQRPDGLLGRAQTARIPNATRHYDNRGIAVGDVTGDGKPDLVIADYLRGLVVVPQS
ncbi:MULTISPECIES: FG-GAP-like repeat-containing protein [unclassified Isoptericola]|uniref:FG-GAP-like repeat-containing protein n=1 Tax=unclassified Isoptericola TaxID=2623355 RepID=UPI0036651A3E